MIKFNKISDFHLIGMIIAASISALGSVPYGYRFGVSYGPDNDWGYALGILLGVTAGLANAALGTYSLLNMKQKQKDLNPIYLSGFSVLSAIPTGCMCFSAYENTMSIVSNLALSLITILVNAAISYTAMLNLFLETKRLKKTQESISQSEIVFRFTGFVIGTLVSITAYMAALHGLTGVFETLSWKHPTALKMASIIAVFTWLPYAALFANATQVIAGKFHHVITDLSKYSQYMTLDNLLIFIVAWCSGASFAQIASDFFDPSMGVPLLGQMEGFIVYFITPAAFVSSVAVNFLALQNLFSNFDKK